MIGNHCVEGIIVLHYGTMAILGGLRGWVVDDEATWVVDDEATSLLSPPQCLKI